jgi:hypothetical protein
METDRVNFVQMPIRSKLAQCSILLLLFAMLSSPAARCGMPCCPQPRHLGCDEMANPGRSALDHGDMTTMAHGQTAGTSQHLHVGLKADLHESCSCDRVSIALVASPAASEAHLSDLQGLPAGSLTDRRSVADRRSAFNRLLPLRTTPSTTRTSLRI